MKKSEALPGKNFRGADLDGQELLLVMSHVERESVGDEEDVKPVLHFIGEPRGLVLNGINWDTIAACYGDDSDDWAGKKIKIWFDPNVMFGPKRTGGVRVRTPPIKAVPKPTPPPIEEDMSDEIPF